MPRLGPLARADFIRHLRQLGFTGPLHGGRHEIMRRDDVTDRVPNPDEGDISVNLVSRILRQAGISRQDWERL